MEKKRNKQNLLNWQQWTSITQEMKILWELWWPVNLINSPKTLSLLISPQESISTGHSLQTMRKEQQYSISREMDSMTLRLFPSIIQISLFNRNQKLMWVVFLLTSQMKREENKFQRLVLREKPNRQFIYQNHSKIYLPLLISIQNKPM